MPAIRGPPCWPAPAATAPPPPSPPSDGARWPSPPTAEAALGGPIAIVEEGDLVAIDVDARRLDLDIGEEEIVRRLAAWTPPAPRSTSGVLAKYAPLVSSASEGAVTTGARLARALAQPERG